MAKPDFIINLNPRIALDIPYWKINMTDSHEKSNRWAADVDQRSGGDRRQFSYTAYIPERRSGKDRRA